MNIQDKAKELAVELQKCEEVKNFKNQSEKIKKNETYKKMIEDLRKLQIQAYEEEMKNGTVNEELKVKIENMGSLASMNPNVMEYLDAEMKFSMLWQEIIKILGDAVGVDF